MRPARSGTARAAAVKVLIIGGTGVFGSRLAERLAASGHEVIIASRRAKIGQTIATQLGCKWLYFDVGRNPKDTFESESPDIVVDAAGPFQAYGDNGYSIAKNAIALGIHYLDFSDDAAFTQGIRSLDSEAKAAQVTALSGVSTVPAISSAIVSDLTADLAEITVIESAILPGNQAPRGRAVMAAILAQVGEPIAMWRGNKTSPAAGWSGQTTYSLESGLNRRGAFIGAPDLALFPEHFKARSVLFRAGLELRLFQQSMRLLGMLRAKQLLPRLDVFTGLFHWMAGWFESGGSDVGGMIVRVMGRKDGQGVSREWQVLARSGDGPCIPVLAAEALINQWGEKPPENGARACLAENTRAQLEAQLATLDASTHVSELSTQPHFERHLSQDWAALPAPVKRAHDIWDMESFSGTACVERGRGPIAAIIAALFGFPKSMPQVDVRVTMERIGNTEVWTRQFGKSRFRSVLSFRGDGSVTERFGPLLAELGLHAKDGAVYFPVKRAWLFGLPLPKWLTPISTAREYAADGRFHFDIQLSLPGIGLFSRYQGSLKPDAD